MIISWSEIQDCYCGYSGDVEMQCKIGTHSSYWFCPKCWDRHSVENNLDPDDEYERFREERYDRV